MDFLKWDTAQPGAKLAAMSNKSKSQPPPPPQQQQQPQHHPSHVIKPVDQLPPCYQPPPPPTSGILKNHLHFTSGTTSAPTSAGQVGNSQGPGATLNHHQSAQPRTLPPLPPPSSAAQHHTQHQQHQVQQQQAQQQQPPKDAQGKYSPRIEHHLHHPQPGNALIVAASAAAKSQQQPPTYLQQPKLGQGSYLPPSSQYPAVSSTQNAPIRQKISDDEFLRLGPVEMLKFVRKTESDIARLAAEQHRQIQNLVSP